MAYRADIEIAVRGAQELKRLGDQINATSKLVDGLNNYLENIGTGGVVRNINNLQQVVSDAAAALNEAALGTKEATLAAQNYVAATSSLNSGLREKLQLLKQVNEAERQQRLSSAGIRETTQFGEPIGPGQASQVALSTPLRGRLQQLIDEKKGARELAAALGELEERRRQETNAILDQRAASFVLQEQRRQEKFLAGATQYAEPIGPGQASPVALSSQLRGRTEQILAERKGAAELTAVLQDLNEQQRQLENSKLDAKATRIQQELDQQAAAATETATQIDKLSQRQAEFTTRTDAAAAAARRQTAEFYRQQRLLRQAQTGFSASTVEQGPGGLGFSGGFTPAQRQQANEDAILRSRQEQNKARRQSLELATREQLFELKLERVLERNASSLQQRAKIREATGNAIIGGAFPLLFGQGVGAAAGGGIGGFAGGLAGGQFGFGLSLVGTALGSTFDQAAQKSADFARALRGNGDAVQSLEALVGSLDSTTKNYISNLQASGQIAATADASFKALSDTVGRENAKALKDAGEGWSGFGKTVTATLTTITAEVIRTFKEVEKASPQRGGFSIASFIGRLALQGEQRAQTTPALTPEAQQRVNILQKETDILRTQTSISSLSLRSNIDQFVAISKRLLVQERLKKEAEIEFQAKQGSLTAQERLLALQGAQLTQQAAFNQLERQRAEELARRQEEAARTAEQQIQARLTASKSIFDEQLKLIDINIREQEFAGGQEAALRRSLQLSEARARLVEQSLSVERDLALAEAAKNGTTAETLRLFNLKLKIAQYDLNLQDAINERLIDRNKLEKQLAATQRQRDIAEALRPIQQQQARAGLDIAGFTVPEAQIEAERLLLDQRIRTAETLLPIQERIADLTAEITSGSLDPEALAAKEADLNAQQQKLGLINQELVLLDKLEAKQLQLQQFSAKYGQLIQSVSGELANVITFGVAELVRGTKTAEQVFADFLNAVGSALLQTAQQMIAQYIAIGIAKIFAGLGGGGFSGNAAGFGGSVDAGIPALPGIPDYSGAFRANGGPVSAGSPYVVGEHGPELFVPGRNGSVVSNSGLRDAMGAAPGSGGSPVLNMSFQTTSIGGVEYVSRDQLEAAMAETRRQATRDGASRGMTMTLDRIKQSPQTRSRIGIR